MTDVIKSMHEDPKFFHYSNEADMINRIVLGMPAKKFRQLHGMEKGESIREYLAPWQAEAIQKLQSFDIGLVKVMPDFSQRKTTLQTYFNVLDLSDSVRMLPGKVSAG